MSTQGNDEVADILFEMLKELASELDLHYEDEDFFALSPSITVMQRAAGYLNKMEGSCLLFMSTFFAATSGRGIKSGE